MKQYLLTIRIDFDLDEDPTWQEDFNNRETNYPTIDNFINSKRDWSPNIRALEKQYNCEVVDFEEIIE